MKSDIEYAKMQLSLDKYFGKIPSDMHSDIIEGGLQLGETRSERVSLCRPQTSFY